MIATPARYELATWSEEWGWQKVGEFPGVEAATAEVRRLCALFDFSREASDTNPAVFWVSSEPGSGRYETRIAIRPDGKTIVVSRTRPGTQPTFTGYWRPSCEAAAPAALPPPDKSQGDDWDREQIPS